MARHVTLAALVLIAAASIVACDNDATSGPSNVTVLLTDAPIDLTGVSAVNVTLSGVILYPTDVTGDEEGFDLNEGPIAMPGDLTINLLEFRNGETTLLGSASVPDGSYNRVRLEVVSAELVRDDDGDPATPDIVEEITVPSGKVDVVAPFHLEQGEDMTLTLDFDAQASVQVNSTNGQNAYLLRPVINLAGMKSS